jgi:hypothetical protein
MPQIGQLAANFPLWWPGFDPRSCHMGSVAKKCGTGAGYLQYLGSPANARIPPSVPHLLINHPNMDAISSRQTAPLNNLQKKTTIIMQD